MTEQAISTVDSLGSAICDDRPLSLMERRRFLQAALVVGTGAVAGPTALAQAAGAQSSTTDTILVTVTLRGGNDGLNTLGPFGNGRYRDLRGALAIDQGSAFDAGNGLMWHPNMRRLATRFRRGDVAVIHGVGEPNRDQSHFVNLARWQSGSPNGAVSRTGWLGRWLDANDQGQFSAIGIGGQGVPLHMRGDNVAVTDVPSRSESLFGSDHSDIRDVEMYRAMEAMAGASTHPWVNRVGEVMVQSIEGARAVSPALANELPDLSQINTDLVLAARLINLNLGTRVLNVWQQGYDTHDNQIGSTSAEGEHADLLNDLDIALDTFFATLSPAMAERVVVMVYSEFGRRAEANGSRGTDHGTSNHAFLVGRRVVGGLYGDLPPLQNLDERGNFRITMDLRRLYSTVIEQALGSDSAQVLGGSYQSLDGVVLPTSTGGGTPADRAAEIRARRQRRREDYLIRSPRF